MWDSTLEYYECETGLLRLDLVKNLNTVFRKTIVLVYATLQKSNYWISSPFPSQSFVGVLAVRWSDLYNWITKYLNFGMCEFLANAPFVYIKNYTCQNTRGTLQIFAVTKGFCSLFAILVQHLHLTIWNSLLLLIVFLLPKHLRRRWENGALLLW